METWETIQQYPGYEVSTEGRVRSKDRIVKNRYGTRPSKGKLRALKVHRDGYLTVTLVTEEKYHTCTVHRLVGETFIPNPDNLPVVGHKDNDKTNNRVTNLEWCTYSHNNKHCYDTGRRTAPNRKQFLISEQVQ